MATYDLQVSMAKAQGALSSRKWLGECGETHALRRFRSENMFQRVAFLYGFLVQPS